MPGLDPTLRRQELGDELRALRKAAQYTLEQAARVINVSPSKLSRMETGHRNAALIEVSALLAIYRAGHKKRDQLLALTRESDEVGWWQRQRTDYAQQKHTLIMLESKAETIVHVDLTVIPGLLQTGEYTRVIMGQSGVITETEIEDRLATRITRHSVLLQRKSPKLLAVIDELALHRVVHSRAVLRRQLEHLVAESARPNISIRVVPNNGQSLAGLDGSFVILRRPGFSPVVFIEHLTSGLFIEERTEVDTYELALRNLLNRALGEEQSVALVASLAKRLDTEASNGWRRPAYTI